MTNEAIGEREVVLGGRTWKLTPSFEAMVEVERRTGRGILDLYQSYRASSHRHTWTVDILYAYICAGILPGNQLPSYEQVGRWAFDSNLMMLGVLAFTMIQDVLTRGQESVEKKVPAGSTVSTGSVSSAPQSPATGSAPATSGG